MRLLSFIVFFVTSSGLIGVRASATEAIRIVAFGDSTTASRGSLVVYATLLEKKLAARALPRVEIVNAGQGGNTTVLAKMRFEKDVLAAIPALVIVQFGINDSTVDVWKSPPAEASRVPLELYRANLRYFVESVRATGAKVILMTPNPLTWTPDMQKRYGKPPYDPNASDGFNVRLVDYAKAVRELAVELTVPLVDVARAHEEFTRSSTESLLLDGMHPNQRGQELVAQLLADLIEKDKILSD